MRSLLPLRLLITCLYCPFLVSAHTFRPAQQPISSSSSPPPSSAYHTFPPIKRVAVIGVGPSGLIFTDTLCAHGFEVRMFEKAPKPGGNWYYTDVRPVREEIPTPPMTRAASVPDIPDVMPFTREYEEGDEGKTLDWRVREHWVPSAMWKNLKSTVPPFLMELPNVQMPPDTPWHFNQQHMMRYVRQYASSIGLNANDEESANITSYSTRVERVRKVPCSSQPNSTSETEWALTLRRLTALPSTSESNNGARVKVEWWEERFDAVVLGSNSESDAPFVPDIPGLKEVADMWPEEVGHVRSYRDAKGYEGKNVLLVGGALSGMGVANDLVEGGANVFASVRPLPDGVPPVVRAIRDNFPTNTTFVPVIRSFGLPKKGAKEKGLSAVQVKLVNGTTLDEFDHIIFATGYRKSFPSLADYHNNTIQGLDDPETVIAPIITDGTHLRSLHWTGHYIDDPTLLIATIGTYGGLGVMQALGAARTWSGTARIPNQVEMWKQNPGPGREVWGVPALGEVSNRLFLAWLNNEALELGGKMVEPMSSNHWEAFDYFANTVYCSGCAPRARFEGLDDMPRSEWPSRNGQEREDGMGGTILGYHAMGGGGRIGEDDWMGFQNRW